MLRPFLAALGFLTACPVPRDPTDGTAALRRSVWFFPVIGALIGLLLAGLAVCLWILLPSSVLSVCIVAAMVAVTKGLHLDGLADSADAFLSSRPAEQMLAIMKDSRSGPMGVTAIVLVLLVKVAAIAALPSGWLWRALILAPIAGRCAIVWQLCLQKYARSEGGLATLFGQAPWRPALPWWSAACLLAAGWLLAGLPGLAIGPIVAITAVLFGAYCNAKIRGFTGDTLGALCEISEAVSLAAISACAHMGILP
jgi:adenosylcobinamide-GDP ribazoletransferase